MPQVFYKDGSAVPDAKVAEAVASGQAFAKSERVSVKDANGTIGTIDASELGHPGYQLLSDDEIDQERIHKERGTVGQQAITAAEGAARGASFGLSDVALTHALGDKYRKGALERREENSTIATGSEIGGAIVPGLLSGGESVVAEGAGALSEGSSLARGARTAAKVIGAPVRAVSKLGGVAEGVVKSGLEAAGFEGKTLASRALAKAAGIGAAGATEGAVFGAGSTISESQLKGEPLTSEALVASMGRNALFGGAIGAGAGLLGELAPTLLKKALPTPEKLEEHAIGFARKQLGRDFENVGKAQTREVAEGWKDASAKQLLERKLVGGENAGRTVLEASKKPVDIADNLSQMKADIGGEIGATHEKVSALIDQAPELGPNAQELIARLEKKADEFRGQHNSGAYSQARAIQGEIRALKNAIQPHTPGGGFIEAAEKAPTDYEALESRVTSRLSPTEQKAIHDYTATDFAGMNEAARGPKAYLDKFGPGMTAERQAANRRLQSILDGQADAGNVYRGEVQRVMNVPDEAVEGWLSSGSMTNESAWSTSADPAFAGTGKANVHLHITDADAVPVSKFSKVASEKEALIPKDRTFFVDRSEDIDGVKHIWLEQHRPTDLLAEAAGHQAQSMGLPGSPANDVAPSFGYNQIRAWQQNLRDQLNPAGTPNAMRGAVVKNLAAREAVSEIANDYIKETAGKVLTAAGEDGSQLVRLNREYASAMSMEVAARKEADRVLKNRRSSLTDHMLGIGSALTAMASGNVGTLGVLGFGAAASIGNKMLREQGNAAMAQILHRASKMDSLVESAAKALSATPERLVAPIDLASHREASTYIPLGGRKLAQDFGDTRERVRQLANPDAQQAQLAHATASFGNAYPDAATGASQQLLKLFQHLNESLPQARGGSPLSPLARPASVTPREMHRFLTRVNAALDPASVISDIAGGKLDRDAVDTLQAVYPQTYDKLRSKAMEAMVSSKEEVPFTRAVLVSRLFKFDGDSSMGPRLATIQESIKQANAAENNPPKAPSRTLLKLGKSFSLPGQHAPGES